jgi:hypothetical protein
MKMLCLNFGPCELLTGRDKSRCKALTRWMRNVEGEGWRVHVIQQVVQKPGLSNGLCYLHILFLSRLLLRRKIGAAPSHLGMPKRTVHASNKFIRRIPNHICSFSASGQELLTGRHMKGQVLQLMALTLQCPDMAQGFTVLRRGSFCKVSLATGTPKYNLGVSLISFVGRGWGTSGDAPSTPPSDHRFLAKVGSIPLMTEELPLQSR